MHENRWILLIITPISQTWPPPFKVNSVNKKVLLCERKRHTDCSISSTPSVTCNGVPPWPGLMGGTQGGVPPGQVSWEYLRSGTPLARYDEGYLRWLGYPPPFGPGRGTPPSHRCEQTENITFPHPSDAVGKNINPLQETSSLKRMFSFFLKCIITCWDSNVFLTTYSNPSFGFLIQCRLSRKQYIDQHKIGLMETSGLMDLFQWNVFTRTFTHKQIYWRAASTKIFVHNSVNHYEVSNLGQWYSVIKCGHLLFIDSWHEVFHCKATCLKHSLSIVTYEVWTIPGLAFI